MPTQILVIDFFLNSVCNLHNFSIVKRNEEFKAIRTNTLNF